MSAEEEIRTNHTSAEAEREPELAQIREALRGLRFGAVNIIVQDGVVVQIDRTEKRRVRGCRRVLLLLLLFRELSFLSQPGYGRCHSQLESSLTAPAEGRNPKR
jgi:hypothetical protein